MQVDGVHGDGDIAGFDEQGGLDPGRHLVEVGVDEVVAPAGQAAAHVETEVVDPEREGALA